MIESSSGVVGLATIITFGLVLLGIIGSFIRMVRGPTLADRVVALDMLTILMVAFVGVYTIATGRAAFLDVAIALALVGFLGTVAFARYAERRLRQDATPPGEEEKA